MPQPYKTQISFYLEMIGKLRKWGKYVREEFKHWQYCVTFLL